MCGGSATYPHHTGAIISAISIVTPFLMAGIHIPDALPHKTPWMQTPHLLSDITIYVADWPQEESFLFSP